MLFDLRGKRRRLIQVVYAALAILMGGGLILFGIGSDAPGGLSEIFGGDDGGTSNPQYEAQIEEAENTLKTDPKDTEALLTLARVHFLAGQSELETDPETGVPAPTEEARTQFQESVDAWDRYLETKPKRPDSDVAGLVVQAFVTLEDADGAVEAQEIVVEDRPSSGAYGQLALYRYASGDIAGGDEAAERALEEADAAQRAALKDQLDQIAEQAQKLVAEQRKQRKQQPEGGSAGGGTLEDPFSQLGGGLGGAPAPAP